MEASETGIDFSNRLSEEKGLENDHLLIGSGAALGDVDGDGRTDLYLTRLEGRNALYLNRWGWRFEEVAVRAGVALPDRYSTGATLADLDGDGDLDLLVSAQGQPNAVFENDGQGGFTDVSEEAGLTSPLAGTTIAVADVDGDGDLDVYQTNYKRKGAKDDLDIYQNPGADRIVREGDTLAVAPRFREHFRLVEFDDGVGTQEYAEPDRLYLNDGSGRFDPASWTDGRFLDADGDTLEQAPALFGLAARFYDVDGDGDPDLYVCNDFQDPDQFWINQGDGTFQLIDRLALRNTSHASMSVDFADVDRDGHADFFVADMMSPGRGEELRKMPLHHVPARHPIGNVEGQPQYGRNTLFRNRGDGTFAQVAELAGVAASGWTWGSLFLDVDLDGYEDLLVANGHGRDMQDADVAYRVRRAQGTEMTWEEAKSLYPHLDLENMAFHNRGGFDFEPAGERWGFSVEGDVSHGLAAGDLDGDGDQDVVVNRLNSPVLILRNDAPAPRVAVRLDGRPPNTRGLGARVRLTGGGQPVQEKEMTAGGLYLSSSAPLLTFAAGAGGSETDRDAGADPSAPLTLEVVWPDGAVSRIEGVEPDRLYEISQPSSPPAGEGSPAEEGPREGAADRDEETPEVPLFVDVSRRLDHVHPETPFDDYRRQGLLPFRPGRLGPGVSWVDVDGDDDPDLVVPPGRGGRLGYLRNEGGDFRTVTVEETPGRYDRTTALPVPAGPGFLVGQATYEASDPGEARRLPTALRVGAQPGRVDSVVPGHLHSAGPLSLADVDGDGDLDLFVGGRLIPTLYPVSATSRLFRNEGGRFVRDEANREVLEDLGLVSASVFTDLDGDGDPDLLLAVEWGPPRVLLNEDGRFRDATDEWGLAELTGRWNGVATGDLNADGRPDAVLTSWGRNLRNRPEDGRPLLLYHGNLNSDGQYDVLLAQESPEGSTVYPLERYERIQQAMPSLARRFDGFDAYAEATMDDLLAAAGAGDRYGRRSAATYQHHLLINEGDRFRVSALPVRAQETAAFGPVVADFDGDGHDDVFLSQNFFSTEPFTPRLDAGVGLWLRGDGTGGLDPVPAARSGLYLWGDGRGAAAADYDGDGRIDLAVGQNGGETRLFRNVGARPGLRVRLRGPETNPLAVGAAVRAVYADGRGPLREIQAGSGYWSTDGTVQVLGLEDELRGVWVRWPSGETEFAPLEPDRRDVTLRR